MDNIEKLGRCICAIDYKYAKGNKLCRVYSRYVGSCTDCPFNIIPRRHTGLKNMAGLDMDGNVIGSGDLA